MKINGFNGTRLDGFLIRSVILEGTGMEAGDASLQLYGDSGTEGFNAISSITPWVEQYKCNGKLDAPTKVVKDDVIGKYDFGGYTLAGWKKTFSIEAIATDNFDGGAYSRTRLAFFGFTQDTQAATEVASIDSSGVIALPGLLITSSQVTTALGFTPENVANKSTDTTMAVSDTLYPTKTAVRSYIASVLTNIPKYKGALDCSANPNYPAAALADMWLVQIAGRIGGASGVIVVAGDMFICMNPAGSVGGTQAAVGTDFNVINRNINHAVIGPATATDNAIMLFNGTTGTSAKDSAKTIVTTLGVDDTTLPTSGAVQIGLASRAEGKSVTTVLTGALLATDDTTGAWYTIATCDTKNGSAIIKAESLASGVVESSIILSVTFGSSTNDFGVTPSVEVLARAQNGEDESLFQYFCVDQDNRTLSLQVAYMNSRSLKVSIVEASSNINISAVTLLEQGIDSPPNDFSGAGTFGFIPYFAIDRSNVTGTPIFTNIIDSGLTASKMIYANSSKRLVTGSASMQDGEYIQGLTANAQDQLMNRQIYHGFENRTDSATSFTNATRTFTLQSAIGANYVIYVGGFRWSGVSTKTVVINNVAGLWYITAALDGTHSNIVLTASQTAWNITDLTAIPVAIIWWDTVASKGRLWEERHGYKRNVEWHSWAHTTIGARYVSGLTGTFTTNTISVTSGSTRDEDISNALAGTITRATMVYRATGGVNQLFDDTPVASVIKTNGTNPVYDNSGTLTALANNQYGITWIYATSDKTDVTVSTTNTQLYAVLGQGAYSSVALAQAASLPAFNSDINTAEWKLLYRVIYQRTSGAPAGTYIPPADDLRATSTGPANAGSTSTQLAASTPVDASGFIQNLSATDTNVQTALQTLDKASAMKSLQIAIDGQGFAMTASEKTPYIFVPYACTITGYEIRTDAADNITLRIRRAVAYNGTMADITTDISMTSGGGNTKADATTGSFTATTLAKGDMITISITSAGTTATWLNLRLTVV